MSNPVAQHPLGPNSAAQGERRVVVVVSGSAEPSLSDVVTNLATVCAEIGQRVALLSTSGLASPGIESELPQSSPSWWESGSSAGNGAGLPVEEERSRLLHGSLSPADLESRFGETGVPGVSRLDLRDFVGHPAQVVIRVPEVLAALREIVDVVFLEIPSYLSVHHGEGLTPLADVVLVVAERETTTMDDMRQISAALRHLEAPVVGMALTEGGLEFYDWGRVDLERKGRHQLSSDERDPTEQIPISETTGITPAPSFEELPVVEHAPREV
jgi:Mrp family chromosome partitioning ATPase